MDEHILHLGDGRYPVDRGRATLHALVSNATDFELYWMISVPCFGALLYWESMRFSFRDWRDLAGQVCRSDPEDDDQPGILLHGHEDIEECEIHFVGRDGVVFDIDWRFAYAGQPGRVCTSVRFTDVTVWLRAADTEEKARERLGRDLELSLFAGPEAGDQEGQFRFRPLEGQSPAAFA